MAFTTAAGSALAISAVAPATNDQAGFTALTFTEIGGIDKIGPVGASFEKVEFQPLKGPKDKLKGPPDYGSLQPSYAIDETDAGQTLLRTAAEDETNKLFSFKLTLATGALRYWQGRCFGVPESVDAANSVLMANPTVEVCKKIVKVAAP